MCKLLVHNHYVFYDSFILNWLVAIIIKMISITFRLVTFLVISLLNILYAIIWIAGVQVNFAVGTHGNFLAFGGTFQERILQGIYIYQ